MLLKLKLKPPITPRDSSAYSQHETQPVRHHQPQPPSKTSTCTRHLRHFLFFLLYISVNTSFTTDGQRSRSHFDLEQLLDVLCNRLPIIPSLYSCGCDLLSCCRPPVDALNSSTPPQQAGCVGSVLWKLMPTGGPQQGRQTVDKTLILSSVGLPLRVIRSNCEGSISSSFISDSQFLLMYLSLSLSGWLW